MPRPTIPMSLLPSKTSWLPNSKASTTGSSSFRPSSRSTPPWVAAGDDNLYPVAATPSSPSTSSATRTSHPSTAPPPYNPDPAPPFPYPFLSARSPSPPVVSSDIRPALPPPPRPIPHPDQPRADRPGYNP